MNSEFQKWVNKYVSYNGHTPSPLQCYNHLKKHPQLLQDDGEKGRPLPTFKGKRIDNGMWVQGQYVTTPLTDENSGLPSESGWFFLTGEIRHCIVHRNVAFSVDPETISVIKDSGLHLLREDGLTEQEREAFNEADALKGEGWTPEEYFDAVGNPRPEQRDEPEYTDEDIIKRNPDYIPRPEQREMDAELLKILDEFTKSKMSKTPTSFDHPKQKEECCTPEGQIKRYVDRIGCDSKPEPKKDWTVLADKIIDRVTNPLLHPFSKKEYVTEVMQTAYERGFKDGDARDTQNQYVIKHTEAAALSLQQQLVQRENLYTLLRRQSEFYQSELTTAKAQLAEKDKEIERITSLKTWAEHIRVCEELTEVKKEILRFGEWMFKMPLGITEEGNNKLYMFGYEKFEYTMEELYEFSKTHPLPNEQV